MSEARVLDWPPGFGSVGAQVDDDVEDLEDVDDHRHEHDDEHRGQHRDRDAPQRLPLGGPVDLRRLQGLAVESGQARPR